VRPNRGLFAFAAALLLVSALLAGCQGTASGDHGRYGKETYTYKVVNGHEIGADVHRLPGVEVRPGIIWLHPGALIVGSREWLASEQLQAYLGAGYVVIAIDCRLAPETELAGIVEDIADAYR
jgi:acetyl esterase/lipase